MMGIKTDAMTSYYWQPFIALKTGAPVLMYLRVKMRNNNPEITATLLRTFHCKKEAHRSILVCQDMLAIYRLLHVNADGQIYLLELCRLNFIFCIVMSWYSILNFCQRLY